MAQDGVVRAAGGVVSRRDEGGEVEVLLVHRPQHGDWSFLSYPGDRELLAAFAGR